MLPQLRPPRLGKQPTCGLVCDRSLACLGCSSHFSIPQQDTEMPSGAETKSVGLLDLFSAPSTAPGLEEVLINMC